VAAHVGTANGADLFSKFLVKLHLHKAVVMSNAAFTKLVETRSDVVGFEENSRTDLAEQGRFLDCVKQFRAYEAFIGLGENARSRNHIQEIEA